MTSLTTPLYCFDLYLLLKKQLSEAKKCYSYYCLDHHCRPGIEDMDQNQLSLWSYHKM